MKQVIISLVLCCATFGRADEALLPADYESKTAENKFDLLMDHVKATEGTAGNFPNPVGYFQFIVQDDLAPTCDEYSDLIPYNHEKRIHSVGPVAAMELTSTGDHPYTGLFQTGTPHALVRLSVATKPLFGRTIPGLAVKFLRDGMPSANFVAMYSLDGQPGGNFFENSFTNQVNSTTSIAKRLIFNKFADVSDPAEAVGLSDIAAYNVDGTKVKAPVFPAEIILMPNEDLKERFAGAPATQEDLDAQFQSVPVNTALYTVHARATPTASETQHIGTMRITSTLMSTSFGDDNLFFRHQRLDEDLELRPEWKKTRRGLRKGCPLGMDKFD